MATKRSGSLEHSKQEEVIETENTDSRRWQGVTALILAVLATYLLWLPVVNFILALMAVVFGIWGLRSREKIASVVGVIMGVINISLIMVACLGLAIVWRLLSGTQDEDEIIWEEMPVGPVQLEWQREQDTDCECQKKQASPNRHGRRSELGAAAAGKHSADENAVVNKETTPVVSPILIDVSEMGMPELAVPSEPTLDVTSQEWVVPLTWQ